MALGPQYCRQLRRELRRFANFPPNRPIAPGDYGVLREDVFERLGNIRQLGIPFEIIPGSGQSTFTFRSKGSVDFSLITKGEAQPGGIPALRAGIELRFAREEAVFFSAAGCTIQAIDNIAAVGTALVELMKQGKWEADFYVVTELNRAERTTAIASAEKGSEVRLEAKSPALEEIEIGDAGLELRVKRSRSTALEIVTEAGHFPLMQLSRIRGFWREQFRPEFAPAGGDMAASSFTFSPEEHDDIVVPVRQAAVTLDPPLNSGWGGTQIEPESEGFAVRELQARPSEFELERAVTAYIPLLQASYALANAELVIIPPGYEIISEIRADRTEMAEALEVPVPEAQEAVNNDIQAAESTAVPEAFGFVVREQSTGNVIVAIRGTQTPGEWIKNFTAVPNSFNDAPGFGLVHLGFEQMWHRIRSSVAGALAAVPGNTRVTVLGHSLGGAMGALGAVDIRRNLGKANVDLCTFGGPRPAKVRFRMNFNNLIQKCFRVTNQNDIVPHVPSVITGWNHVGLEIEVNGRTDRPHSLEAYLAGLRNIGSAREISTSPQGVIPEAAMVTGVLSAHTL